MIPVPLLFSPIAAADIAVPRPPPRGSIATDLPPPDAPPVLLSPTMLNVLSVGLGLALVGSLLWKGSKIGSR